MKVSCFKMVLIKGASKRLKCNLQISPYIRRTKSFNVLLITWDERVDSSETKNSLNICLQIFKIQLTHYLMLNALNYGDGVYFKLKSSVHNEKCQKNVCIISLFGKLRNIFRAFSHHGNHYIIHESSYCLEMNDNSERTVRQPQLPERIKFINLVCSLHVHLSPRVYLTSLPGVL